MSSCRLRSSPCFLTMLPQSYKVTVFIFTLICDIDTLGIIRLTYPDATYRFAARDRPAGASAAIGVYLEIAGCELFLGEAVCVDGSEAMRSEFPSAALVLKFAGDLGPNPSGLAGFKRAVRLKLLDKEEGQDARKGIAARQNEHGGSPSKISPEMREAGAREILGELGGLDLGGSFCPHTLAERVYLAMQNPRRSGRFALARRIAKAARHEQSTK